MKIYLVRHGNNSPEKILNSDGFPDTKLTELGRRQAEAAGKHLAGINFDAIYSSDLIRAKETAAIISFYQSVELPILIEPKIKEINMGIFHTSSEDQIKTSNPEFYEEFLKKEHDFKYPGGESGEDVKIRVLSFLESLNPQNNSNICLVSHGGVIRSIVSHFIGLPQHKRFNLYPYNCGITILEYDYSINNFKVITINETIHLEDIK